MSSSSVIPFRFLLSRFRRFLVLLLFFSVVTAIAWATFAFVNGGGAGQMARRVADRLGAGAEDTNKAGRGIVQYYPDNRNKYLFRRKGADLTNRQVEMEERSADAAQKRVEEVKERLVGDEERRGTLDDEEEMPAPNRVGSMQYCTMYTSWCFYHFICSIAP